MAEKRRGLGRGLGALIPSGADQQDEAQTNGRASERGRPVDLFFPSAGSNGSGSGDVHDDGPNSDTRPATKSSINKDALTAPSRRSPNRSQASTKTRPSPAKKTGAAAGKHREPDRVDEASTPPASRVTAEVIAEPVDPGVSAGAPDEGEAVPVEPRIVAEPESNADVPRETLQEVPGARFAELPVESIHPNRKQPRTVFDEDEMAELVHSIREIGVLQPIVVRHSNEGGEHAYELVMGERRWRATREAGLSTVPAIVRDTTDDDLLRDALLENLHRSQLNPLEEAAAYQQLLDDFGCSQEELASRIGRSRPQISNTLRLMKLPPLVQRRLAAGVLSAGHARALLGLADPAEMEKLAQRIVAEGLSVRSTEEIVAMSEGLRRPSKPATPKNGARHERLDYLATSLADRLDTNVKITLGAKKGRVSIEFASVDDLNRIMGVLTPS